MTNCIIDYESYYDKTLSVTSQGNVNYMRDADAYIVAATVGDEVVCGTIAEMGPTMEQIIKDTTVQCWAANSNFDEGWSDKYYGPSAQNWKCVLDLGSYHQYPRYLSGLAKVATGRPMDKTTRDEMKGVRYEDLSEEKKNHVQQYCMGDVIRTKEVLDILPPMSPMEDKIAAHTRMMNRRGVHINLDLVAEDKTKMEQMRFDATKAVPWHLDGPLLSYPQLEKWCHSKGIPCPKSTAKTDEDCADLMSEHPELNAVLTTLRRFRKANTLLKKVEALTARVSDDGILPLDILYCGAPHTRRWSSKGFNVQNLDKAPMKVTDELSVWTRNWIVPPPGHEFLILDFAQVEPRCLNWLCGNDDMMEALRHGFSYYEAYYRASRGWKGEKGTLKAELIALEGGDKVKGQARYTKLKNEALGCGYGMGWKKYITYAGVEAAEAKKVIDGFRKLNPKVVAIWRQLDNVIISAARDKARHLAMTMPSGDLLQYFNVRSSPRRGYEGFTIKGEFSENNKQPSLWGGTLTENVTQRFARDILAESIVRLEENGFPVAFHAHDEVILVVPKEGDEAKRKAIKHEAERLTAMAPAWASTIPLGVEGDYAPCYTKL